MTRALEFVCPVVDGRLPERDARRIGDVIRKFDGKRIVVSIREQKKPRSLNQNAFYHGPFIEAFRVCLLECGHRLSSEDIHSGLRDAYAKNGYTLMLPGGKPFSVPPSTSRLSTIGFEEFLEEIRAYFASEFGWQLPLPNEVPTHAPEL
ncbi:hypothetical protein [Fimbriiglobus ruber]|uniref:Uncharacterized protein n=1 Tax=Fimbriiglobus ruber TaxID=1908690 RepID=A0A225DKV5_9BACT|nr:hypothetical protein [Fimbriiglobus ruber]OWK42032.1 hypothetical protein FRUB_04110 [Fimbriiglobus ruber]